ncbi:class I SAM-dependent methyltransferase [Luteimonas panaciterrae]|uniref:class I SAM-dependent methyltransferase n=1 Tax=Luteimonas panaciterrae TaxID=363885 RepID=UPI001CFBC2D4|nr:class I SAM-dependent methyltransferase [Luteimonas panaciterrae]
MTETLHAWMSELERDRSLFEPDKLRQRLDVLDRLENYLVGAPWEYQERIKILSAELEEANQRLYQSMRQEIQRGKGAETLLEWARAIDSDALEELRVDGERYDHLDALLAGVLQLEAPASDVAEPHEEMVFYQPTPARYIFELIRRAGISERDVLIDLGSGLGHVPLLVAICTGARCIGIEWEAAYVDCARRCANELNLPGVTFIQQDAREADLSTGTVFYLYTPFKGAMLSEMLAVLKWEAPAREIRICTLGPCTEIVAREPWLERLDVSSADTLAVFRSL